MHAAPTETAAWRCRTRITQASRFVVRHLLGLRLNFGFDRQDCWCRKAAWQRTMPLSDRINTGDTAPIRKRHNSDRADTDILVAAH